MVNFYALQYIFVCHILRSSLIYMLNIQPSGQIGRHFLRCMNQESVKFTPVIWSKAQQVKTKAQAQLYAEDVVRLQSLMRPNLSGRLVLSPDCCTLVF